MSCPEKYFKNIYRKFRKNEFVFLLLQALLGGHMDGWVDVKAGLRTAWSHYNVGIPLSKTPFGRQHLHRKSWKRTPSSSRRSTRTSSWRLEAFGRRQHQWPLWTACSWGWISCQNQDLEQSKLWGPKRGWHTTMLHTTDSIVQKTLKENMPVSWKCFFFMTSQLCTCLMLALLILRNVKQHQFIFTLGSWFKR